MVIVLRHAATWMPKMRTTSYNEILDAAARNAPSLGHFASAPFAERGRRFSGVLEMRDQKYKAYRELARRAANVVAARYEDLAADPQFLFDKLAGRLPCAAGAAFVTVTNHAKFGLETTKNAVDNERPYAWTTGDWAALRSRVDLAFEASLGYAYRDGPGGYDAEPPPRPTWLALPGDRPRRKKERVVYPLNSGKVTPPRAVLGLVTVAHKEWKNKT